MNLELQGKSAMVIGGSKGIGCSIALRFAEVGAHVAICARGEAALETTANEIRQLGVQAYAHPCDVVGFLASPRASWVTGVCLTVDGGQHKGNL